MGSGFSGGGGEAAKRLVSDYAALFIGCQRYPFSGSFSSFVVVPENQDSLVSQRIDGIEAGRFESGINAKEQSDAHGNSHGQNDGPQGNG